MGIEISAYFNRVGYDGPAEPSLPYCASSTPAAGWRGARTAGAAQRSVAWLAPWRRCGASRAGPLSVRPDGQPRTTGARHKALAYPLASGGNGSCVKGSQPNVLRPACWLAVSCHEANAPDRLHVQWPSEQPLGAGASTGSGREVPRQFRAIGTTTLGHAPTPACPWRSRGCAIGSGRGPGRPRCS
jgi:hypothetical protein